MRFRRAYIAAVRGGDKDCATRVSSLTNEEPLVVVKSCVDAVREVVGEDCGDSRCGVVGKGEVTLCRGGRGSVRKGTFGAENGDIGRSRGNGIHWGSEIFVARRGDEYVIGVDGDVLVEWSKEESIEDFLGYLRGSGRHGEWGRNIRTSLFYNARRPGFLRGIFGWLS